MLPTYACLHTYTHAHTKKKRTSFQGWRKLRIKALVKEPVYGQYNMLV